MLSIDALPTIFSLLIVLLYKDFGIYNIMVNADSNYLFISKYRLGVGWVRYGNYDTLNNNFWNILSVGTGGLEEETIRTIKSIMIVGLLLSYRFTSRLANMPKPEPICDDESGAYEVLGLDGLLIVPTTKLVN
ncbi:Aminoglycoside phosphotransferase [Penicillium verrucosum]|uniref:Aminoglycoside phosphotransferase n=1 Tax=Penicillium verrucosum TaxID=60171 RepID=UPI0025458378|nr:Aminoglycoside phosphotransferase [Penicillium verrucosum]KAJ5944568.1 Aminoglycoside phosphotransferase [Penicillium verrucosum]